MTLGKRGIRLTAAILLTGAVALPASAATEVRVGVYHNPPKILLDANGWPSGILGDLLHEIARENQWNLTTVPCTWHDCLVALQAGTIDILPDVAFNAERAGRFQFHRQPALRSWSQLYRHPQTTLQAITDLSGQRVAVLQDSVQETELRHLLNEFGIAAELVPVNSYDDAFALATRGEVTAAVSNRHYGELHARDAGLVPTPVVFMPARLFYAAAPQADPVLLAQIDRTLESWIDNPDSYYYSVLQAWTPLVEPQALPRWLWPLASAVSLGLLLALVASLWLRRQVRVRTQELRTSEAQLRTILESVDAAIFIKDTDLRYQYANDKVARILGRPVTEIVGHRDADWFDQETASHLEESDRAVLTSGKRIVKEDVNRIHGHSDPVIFITVKLPLRRPDGSIHGLCGISTEITEQRRLVRELQMLSHHDPLTRLPNRRQLLERLRQCLEALLEQPRAGALLLINLDHMRALNEQLGQHLGDQRLQQVAQRLAGCAGAGELAARAGGDEFALLIPDLGVAPQDAATKAGTLARHILQSLARPYDLGGNVWHGTASVGIALFSDPQEGVDDVLRHADMALSQAKAAGRNTFRLFHPDMSAMLAARTGLEADLRTAIAEEQFVLHYQPQVDDFGEITGYEAMVRWQHPRRGLLLPVHFIPFAEASDHILALGDWVLRTACRQLAQWGQSPKLNQLTLAVNLSAREVLHPDGAQHLLRIVAESGANPHRLELELTESQLIEDFEATTERLRELRTAGLRIALDDFGTGYSSLSYLKQLPLDRIKIDMSFVRDLVHDANDVAIVRTIISLAESLDLEVIAEGVESATQRDILRELGCRHFQGYWFGRPQPWHDA